MSQIAINDITYCTECRQTYVMKPEYNYGDSPFKMNDTSWASLEWEIAKVEGYIDYLCHHQPHAGEIENIPRHIEWNLEVLESYTNGRNPTPSAPALSIYEVPPQINSV